MSTIKALFCLVAVAALSVGCGGQSTETDDAVLTAAIATWKTQKPGCESYHYTSTASSVFGSRSVTTIEIVNDQPTRRLFTGNGYTVGGTDAGTSVSWDETGAAVGSHDGAAAPALTVEQLFDTCRMSLMQNHPENQVSLTIDDHGVPIVCGFTSKNCVDDCYEGYVLTDFTCGLLRTDAPPTDASVS